MASYEDDHGIDAEPSTPANGNGSGSSNDDDTLTSSPFATRAIPTSFEEFMSQIHAAGGAFTVDEDLYYEILQGREGSGARQSFISALPRPSSKTNYADDETCPVCLMTLSAIVTEEEYALASEHYFGDPSELGIRLLPCPASHLLCAKCCGRWLSMSNTCPMCRAMLDPQAPALPAEAPAIERQRELEMMLSLFNMMFGQRDSRAAGGGGHHSQQVHVPQHDDSFASMYS